MPTLDFVNFGGFRGFRFLDPPAPMRVLYGPRFLPIPYWAQYEYPTLSIAFSISANSYRGIITSQFQCNATTLHQHTSEY